ncbi:hypothetical protein [Sphingomonas xanthus]|uniref:HTH marR-type domain-containing protein n=1 Tax=Sphingomonas xanthus TaxID=2594473 RepID=A0A516INP0_9SPHN|nr:hypothetical protein [Sphingomonas xanthus]QDP18487.1 hypothetical protein FMM02_00045 [Sphingomonas xanthus]
MKHRAIEPEEPITSPRDSGLHLLVHQENDPILRLVRAQQLSAWLRRRIFDKGIFDNIPWEIVMALFHREFLEEDVTLAELATFICQPIQRCSRWVKALEDESLVVRRVTDFGVYVQLTPTCSSNLKRLMSMAPVRSQLGFDLED